MAGHKQDRQVTDPYPPRRSPTARQVNAELWARVAAELAARQAVLERVRAVLWGPGCEHLPDLDRLAYLDQQKALAAQVELLDTLLDMTEIATAAAVA